MTLRERIETDYIIAFKAKDNTAKAALSSIKAKITEAEKGNTGFVSTDDEIVKIINKAIKQREDSIRMYDAGGRAELSQKEADEVTVLKNYMPAQMNQQEITDALIQIMQGFSSVITNPQALQGKTIGEFNKRYQGRADIGTVKMLLSNLVES